MILNSLTLSNIRSYPKDSDTINFEKGIVLFGGDVGSGKTTILMGIEFALFGSTNKNFYKKLLRNGAKEGHVELSFSVDKDEYKIYRKLSKKGKNISADDCYIIRGKEKKHVTPTEIKKFVYSKLKLDSSKKKKIPLFHYAIYTPQETMKDILSEKKDEKKETIRRIFKLDEYKTAKDNSEMVLRELRSLKDRYEGKSENLEMKENEKLELDKKIEFLEVDIKTLKRDIEKNRKYLDIVKKKKKEWESYQKDLEKNEHCHEILKYSLNSLNQQTTEKIKEKKKLEKDIKRLNEMKNLTKNYEDMKKMILDEKKKEEKKKELEHEIDLLCRDKENFQERKKEQSKNLGDLKRIEKRILKSDGIGKRKKELEKEILELEKRLHNNTGKVYRYKENLKELKIDLKDMEKLEKNKHCPTCKQDIDKPQIEKIIFDIKEKIEESEIEITKLKRLIEALNKKFERKRMDYENIIKEATEINLLKERFESLKKEIEMDWNEKIIRIDREISDLKNNVKKIKILDLKELEKDIKKLEPKWREYLTLKNKPDEEKDVKEKIDILKKEFNELNLQSKDLKENIIDLKKKLKDIDYDEKYFLELEKTMRGYEVELKEKTKILEDKKDLNMNIEKEISDMKFAVEKIKRITKIMNWLREKFMPNIENIERMKMMRINERFKNLFEEWFHDLLSASDMEVGIDEDFQPIIFLDKYDMPLSTLSGGERTSIALAYRLALNTIIKKALKLDTGLLILDEPTDGFSKDQLYNMKDVFDKTEADQIIVVSHERELENIADKVYRVDKLNNVSKVSLV